MFAGYDADPAVRSIVVSYSKSLVCVLTVLVCLRLLGLLDFTVNQKVAGVLALLFCTTYLHYTQNMMENNYILLLALTGFAFQYEWLRRKPPRSAHWLCRPRPNLLTRLTTGNRPSSAASLLVLTAWLTGIKGSVLSVRFSHYAKIALPVYGVFLPFRPPISVLSLRIFLQHLRSVFGSEHKLLNPTLPAAYPFETPFHVGFLGPLITPEKSIFLFDPLLILARSWRLAWKRLRPESGIPDIFCCALLGYICFYAQLHRLERRFRLGRPLRLHRRRNGGIYFRPAAASPPQRTWQIRLDESGLALIAVSAIVQVASLVFWLPLEIYQMETLGHPTFVVLLRFKNIIAFALGKMDAWGLNNRAMTQDLGTTSTSPPGIFCRLEQ